MESRLEKKTLNDNFFYKFFDNLQSHVPLFKLLPSEVDLLSEKFIDGFATQGHSNRGLARFVTGYLVHYSLDGFSWDVISWEERERVKQLFFSSVFRALICESSWITLILL